jgi:hypothetical protein
VISTCLLLTAAVISALPVYVRPQIDQLRHADAILILGGFGDGRYSYGMDLAAQGWAPNVVVSNPNRTRNLEQTEFCAAAPPEHMCTALFPIRLRRKAKGGNCVGWLRSMGGGRSSSSLYGRTFPEPGSYWSGASTAI